MSRRLYWTTAAHRDLVELADYLGADDSSTAIRFLDHAEATSHMLVEADGLGSLCDFTDSRTQGMRVWSVRGFRNHLMFYRPFESGIQIVRVLHAARDLENIFGLPTDI